MSWEPATETERRMQDVLRQGDQETYFRLLSDGDLYIPVAPGNSAWATWSTEDRTHVLAFTSEAALRACLREHAGQCRRIRLDELVHAWPDEEWWLAVNPGLPIEGYLPSWFVKQVSTGDVSMPADERAEAEPELMPVYGGGGGGTTAFDFGGQGANGYEQPRQPGMFRPEPGYPSEPYRQQAPAEAYPAAPDAYPPAPEAYPADDGYAPSEPPYGATSAPVSSTPSGLPRRGVEPPAYADYAPPSAADELPPFHDAFAQPPRDAYPQPAEAYAPRPEHEGYAPADGYGRQDAYAPPQEAYPAAQDAYAPAQDAYPAAQDAYPPAPADNSFMPPAPEAPDARYGDDRGYDRYPAEDAYQPEHPPYGVTGESSYGADAYRRRDLPELPPEPALAPSPVAPPAPAALPVPVEPSSYALAGASEDDIEDELAAAGAAGDTPRFLRALLTGWVYVPLNDGSPVGVRPGDPGFTWRTDLIDGAYSLTVFTSPTRMARRLGPCEFVKVTFVRVARNWPDRSYSLAINPGTEVGANMPGTQMSTLISWAAKKGLIERAEEMERSVEAVYGQPDDPYTAGYTQEPDRKLSPTLMQKLIPAAQVPFYLQRGYDRIAGFVHPAEDLARFDTPESLRSALGLIHDGASDVYVIRWISHRADLYRIPYGGNDVEGMRRADGWVVESPPFRGNGFAPGDSGAMIPEYKVDSIRLPHGATMHRLSSIDGDTLVASFDADQQTWLTAEESL